MSALTGRATTGAGTATLRSVTQSIVLPTFSDDCLSVQRA
ncbi:hypothetical protein ABIA35_002628 [Catenulispora sp. MAP12-49]